MGQNFLKSAKAIADIVYAGNIHEDDTILEIGPGKGVLTEKLLFFSNKVIAVEKDRNLIEILEDKFTSKIKNGNLELIEGDILKLDIDGEAKNTFLPLNYKIIANIPYNITGEILRKFLGGAKKPSKMVLLVQKEVADRIVARDGKESILSLSVKIYGNPRYISKVPARYFSPAPKVDSAIIEISDISMEKLGNIDEKVFFSLVKAGFAHKRKVLKKNLEEILEKEQISSIFKKLDIKDSARAEDIHFDTWVLMAKSI